MAASVPSSVTRSRTDLTTRAASPTPKAIQCRWWTPEDRAKFEERATCVVDQFNGYEVVPGLNINGQLTLGENIGDLGGLNIAYTALMDALKERPRSRHDRRIYAGAAILPRLGTGLGREVHARRLASTGRTDPHSGAQYRVNGPLSNMPEFAKAFGCKPGAAWSAKPRAHLVGRTECLVREAAAAVSFLAN